MLMTAAMYLYGLENRTKRNVRFGETQHFHQHSLRIVVASAVKVTSRGRKKKR